MKLGRFALLLICCPSVASASDLCRTKFLFDVAAIESPTSIMGAGSVLTGVTEFRLDNSTGRTSICSDDGYCYPEHVIRDGRRVVAQELVNCTIDRSRSYRTGDETVFDLVIEDHTDDLMTGGVKIERIPSRPLW